MRSHNRTPAYVLWLGPTGLTIVRALGRYGIPVVGLHHDPDEPATLSRYCRRTIMPRIENDEKAWLNFLLEEGSRIKPQRGVIFPAGDLHWLFLVKHRKALEPYFRFALPEAENLEAWPGKLFQYAAASHAGIHMPRTFIPKDAEEVGALAKRVAYPCLLKPIFSHLSAQAGLRGKLLCVDTPEELLENWQVGAKRGLELMIQEYIPGEDNQIYGLFSYLDKNSRPLSSGVSRKIRQFPPQFGQASFSVSVSEPTVAQTGLRLLQAIRFHGISSVEFKRDARDGIFKFTEINLRAPLLMADVVDGGINLPVIAYRDLCGEPPVPLVGRLDHCKIVYFEDDYKTSLYYRRIGKLSWWSWIMTFFGRTREIYFAWDDLTPFVTYFRRWFWRWRHGSYRQKPEVAAIELGASWAALRQEVGVTVNEA